MKKVNYDKVGKNLSSVGTYIANNKKPLLYVGGAIALVVIAYSIVKRVKDTVSGKNSKKIVGGKFTTQDVDENITTISDITAKNYAENLFVAFNYFWGTDKSTINTVFSKINSEDFKKVYNEFGKRSYGSGGSPGGIERLGLYDDVDLITWINNELDFGDSALREKIRKVVEPAGFVIES